MNLNNGNSEVCNTAMVRYDNAAGTLATNCGSAWDWGTYNTYLHYCPYPYSYPVYEKSKTEQAFKIVGILLKNKVIKELTVAKFIELVNEIAKEI
jgi:hypothetical protein